MSDFEKLTVKIDTLSPSIVLYTSRSYCSKSETEHILLGVKTMKVMKQGSILHQQKKSSSTVGWVFSSRSICDIV